MYNNDIAAEGAKAIAASLQSGKCLAGLNIDLGFNKVGVEGEKAIADALQSGKCPDGFNISLYNNGIGDEGAKAIADAFQSGKCLAGLNIDLSFNNIGDEGAKAIVDALQSGKCPPWLYVDLDNNDDIGNALKKEINCLVQKNNDYHELNALNRFASIRTFFMSTQDFLPQEVTFFIGFLCLQNYDLALNERFTRMNSTKLQEMETKASQLIESPEKLLGYNPGFFQTKESQIRLIEARQQLNAQESTKEVSLNSVVK